MKDKNFTGVVIPKEIAVIEAVKGAFSGDWFDLCAIHRLDGYDSDRFAPWAANLHCKKFSEMGDDKVAQLKAYVVNYFICPNAEDIYDVLAWVNELWPPVQSQAIELTTPKVAKPKVVPVGLIYLLVGVIIGLLFVIFHR